MPNQTTINIRVAANGGFIVSSYDSYAMTPNSDYIFSDLKSLQAFIEGKLSTSMGSGVSSGNSFYPGATLGATQQSASTNSKY